MKKSAVFRLLVGCAVILSALVLGFLATPLSHPIPAHAATVSGFVTRSGSHLMLNGNVFRASGGNSYWWGLDDTPVTQYRVNDALITAQEMGATVMRVQTLGMSVGCALCIEPTLGNFSEDALKRDDYAVAQAGARGIRLIIPLIDNYHNEGLGGRFTFTGWRNLTNDDDFYSNAQVISDFEQYIGVLMNRVNTYTGVAYKDDPAILGWETGNEIYPPVSWTTTIANYIKSVDGHHLVIDGFRGVNADDLAIANIDIVGDHQYPMSIDTTNRYAQQAADGGKAYYIGEYDWDNWAEQGDGNGPALSDYLANLESNTNVSLDTYWNLYSHDDNYGYRKTDGWDLVYPGVSADKQARAQQLRAHAYRLQGITTLPADSIPAAPVITNISGSQIAWQGAALAANYSVERSTTGTDGSWTVICDQCATDLHTPWTDSTQPTGSNSYYRVRAYNRVNQPGPYSQVFQAGPNLAAGATASASSSVENISYGWGLRFANDGQRSSIPGSSLGWISSNNTDIDHNEWFAYDLGSAKTISKVVLYPRSDGSMVGTDFPTNFEIDVSSNGSNWTSVLQKSNYPRPTGGDAQILSFTTQTVQYVRVYANNLPGNDGGTYRMAFAEVEVY
ncbi:discoidin domain-containing protein [Tengunoibacter tsumagoiensis]|uniref:mannan endo-1,4-beta-mannosidase n=1 Tax=Tengunoibacter tsumagoiensis TaxID=2014871 RepID=A0A402A7Z4_9CHLR|nr:discoidin domain-containing protein [Tengunoibacter tsumagoiensis]GCE15125.1 hypothetical protein KTT_49840 [Tengunoibacter tsumagoiensis]